MINESIISLDIEALNINEEGEEAIIPIVRTQGSDGTVSVDYSINNGTATAGEDFTTASGTLTFAPGETRKEIAVSILDDLIPETDETLDIFIGNSVGAVLGGIRTATITIEDNDTAKLNTLTFSHADYSFSEDHGEANITVVRTGNSNETVSVEYITGDDYARADSDYLAVSGTLTFNPGEISKVITVPILNDKLPELNESLNLTLANPVGIELGVQDNARLIIENDDESPYTFEKEIVVSGLIEEENGRRSGPIAFDWTPNGKMLIAKVNGVVDVFDNGELIEQPFIDISSQVNTGFERGLLGLAVHPEFPQKPFVYLAFSYDPPDLEPDLAEGGRVTRLIRVAADPNFNYNKAVPGSEVILLETPPVNNFHAAGAIHFARDGSLFFSHGDGTPVGGPTTVENAEILQSLDNPFGKLFRIDPMTGEGYSDNPFYDGDTTSIQSKIYNYGFRNPWRYTLHPETGEPFIGDVGQARWEEINTGRGVNFGWPLYEGGNGVTNEFLAIAWRRRLGDLYDSEFQALYDRVLEPTAPIYARSHSDGARAIVMGDFYSGTKYPELYQGALFFNDYVNGDVNALLFDAEGNVDSVTPFSQEEIGITQISLGPDSNIYFTNMLTGEIARWVYKGDDDFEFGTDIPGIRVEAEDYVEYSDTKPRNIGGAYRNDNVDIEITTDIGGGFNVGWIAQGEWLTYDVDVPETGLYQIVARVASKKNQEHHLDVTLDGKTSSVSFGGTGGWQSWEDAVVGEINLTAGNHELRLDMGSDLFNVNYVDLIPSVPLVRVEAEDYVEYSDTKPRNIGGAYRNDNVDIEITTDIGGGFNVGWIAQGEWLTYDLDVPETGLYQIVARVASKKNQEHHLDVTLDGKTSSVSFRGTGGWQSWEDAVVGEINLTAGNHELRLDMGSDLFNVNYVDLIPEF